MSILNEYFDKIYCINLDRRPDRWERCSKMFKEHELEVERIPAIDKNNINIEGNIPLNKGQIACCLSHMTIVKNAFERGLSKVLVLEDDVVFSPNLEAVFTKNVNFIPSDWTMLYFGGNHLNGKDHIAHDIFRLKGSLTTHAYAFKKDICELLWNNVMTLLHPIDVVYANIQLRVPSYLIQDSDKQLSWQDEGYSDIDESECNYTWLK